MEEVQLLLKYFPQLDAVQTERFGMLKTLYGEWNEKINVISRKDIDFLYEKHVLHSLAIAKVGDFKDRTSFLDVGTGGGFPGIPLAIMYPRCDFYLTDSIGKKILVVKAVAEALGLENVRAEQIRAEAVPEKFDFVISRAVAPLPEFYQWVRNKIVPGGCNRLYNGILYLKGGDLQEELKSFAGKCRIYDIDRYFEEEFFKTKKIVYIRQK